MSGMELNTQLRKYEDSVKAYCDIVNAVNTARMKGVEEGIEKGRTEERLEIARTMKVMGLDVPAIHKATGLAPEEIEKL